MSVFTVFSIQPVLQFCCKMSHVWFGGSKVEMFGNHWFRLSHLTWWNNTEDLFICFNEPNSEIVKILELFYKTVVIRIQN